MSTVRAVDCSAYQGPVGQDVFRRLRGEHGVRLFVPQLHGGTPDGTGPNPYLGVQVRNALAAGLAVVGGYVWPSWAWPDALAHWQRTLPDVPLRFLALDVEAEAPVHPDQILDIRARGIEPTIYTSWSQWERIMRQSPHYSWFADNNVPIWAAYYPSREWAGDWPETHMPPAYIPRPWETRPALVVGWQFRGTVSLAGSSFDLNVFDPAWRPLWELLSAVSDQSKPNGEDETMSFRCVHMPRHGYAALLWLGYLWVWPDPPSHDTFMSQFPGLCYEPDADTQDRLHSNLRQLPQALLGDALPKVIDLSQQVAQVPEALEGTETELKAELAALADRLAAIESEMAKARGVLGAAKSVLDWLLSVVRQTKAA